MKKIRKQTFETNSSSAHSLTISEDYSISTDTLYIDFDEFGWAGDDLVTPQSKFEYLCTLLFQNAGYHTWDTKVTSKKAFDLLYADSDKFRQVISWLNEEGVEVKSYEGDRILEGYVDHQSTDNLDDIIENKQSLLGFIFGSEPVIITNDNVDY